MRILIINTLYAPYRVGGAEISVQLLAEGLVRFGNQVRILCLHEFDFIKKDIINGVEVCYLPLRNLYWPYNKKEEPSKIKKLIWHILDNYNPLMKENVRNEILDFKPDIIHTNNLAGFSVAVWDVAKEEKIRIVHTARDYYLFHPNTTLFKNGELQNPNEVMVKIWSLVKRKKSRNVDYFVGISDFIRSIYVENGFFNQDCSNFIYNPVEKNIKKNIKKEIETIGFIGRLTEDKGYDEYCNIAEKYKNKYKFLAAGRFNCNSQSVVLEKKSKDLGIQLLGFVEINDFINKVDAVILPIKWNEPFGRSVVECALSGIKVYTNKKGGVSELFNLFENIYQISEIAENQEITEVLEPECLSSDYIISKYLKVYGC